MFSQQSCNSERLEQSKKPENRDKLQYLAGFHNSIIQDAILAINTIKSSNKGYTGSFNKSVNHIKEKLNNNSEFDNNNSEFDNNNSEFDLINKFLKDNFLIKIPDQVTDSKNAINNYIEKLHNVELIRNLKATFYLYENYRNFIKFDKYDKSKFDIRELNKFLYELFDKWERKYPIKYFKKNNSQ